MEILLSLVIPTNGVIEWVIPVLDSIFKQDVDKSLYEVVVTDNGNCKEFREKMNKLCLVHNNLVYKKTTSVLFMNQIDAFKLAKGKFIKFINHRTKLNEGALQNLIDFIKINQYEKPITFFLNSACKIEKKPNFYSEFDSYVYELKNYSSWSGGISCWKEDLNNILESLENNYTLFPHINFCFYYCKDRKYLIYNQKMFTEIKAADIKKGTYDIFYAFGVEYVEIINNLLEKGLIDNTTKQKIIRENELFIANIYLLYVILRKKCSYDISTYKISLSKYYNYRKIRRKAYFMFFNKIKLKLKIGDKRNE